MRTGWNPETETELQAAFDELVCRAYENELLSEDTAYSLRHDNPEKPDWEIVVVRLSKPTTGEVTQTDSREGNHQRQTETSSQRRL